MDSQSLHILESFFVFNFVLQPLIKGKVLFCFLWIHWMKIKCVICVAALCNWRKEFKLLLCLRFYLKWLLYTNVCYILFSTATTYNIYIYFCCCLFASCFILSVNNICPCLRKHLSPSSREVPSSCKGSGILSFSNRCLRKCF